MSKFIIKEIYIDKFNMTHDKLEHFKDGLNIVCGDNEVGKSTIMSFIKSTFLREKIDGSGYINCLNNDKEISFKINNIKENEQYIDNITAHRYRTGFIITLDDLMIANKKDSEELIDIIKDSSGNSVNKKQTEYNDFIYGKNGKNGFITSSNKPSISFKNMFNDLKEIDIKIEELENKENEYNTCCENLKTIEKVLLEKSKEFECAKISNEILNIKKETDKIKINPKLSELKRTYEELKQEYGALKSKKSEENEIKTKINNLNNDYEKIQKDFSKIADYDFEKIKEFNTSIEQLKEANRIIDEMRNLKIQKDNIDICIDNINNSIKNKQKNIDKLNEKINKLKINNFEIFKEDKILTENYLSEYTKEYDKIKQSVTTNDIDIKNYNIFISTFAGLLFAGLGALLLVHDNIRIMIAPIILASFAGLISAIFGKRQKAAIQKNISIKNFDYLKTNLCNLLKKYEMDFDKNNIVIKSNSLIQKMNFAISEYKSISNDLFDENSDLNEYKKQLAEKEKEKSDIENKQTDIENQSKEFLKNSLTDNIGTYPEIYELVKEFQRILNEKEKNNKKINEINFDIKLFTDKLNNFIEDSNIDIEKITEFDYEKFENILTEIQKISDENMKNNQTIEDKRKIIQEKNKIIFEKYNDIKENFIDITDEELDKLSKEFENIKEEKTTALVLKTQLETVEGLSDLRLKRNIEFNNIQKQINELIIKEIILDIICKSKEKFNETQPNLINAKKYLEKITNNKYNEINYENNSISGENIAQKSWSELSRGTKEQLYLSLRLGFASNYSKDKDGNPNGLPNLPILIDDAFVNFDRNRTASILKCLEEFSVTNQVIYFTCHSKYIEELLKTEKIKYNLIKL